MPLELGIEVQDSVGGIEMGVMENGITYLTQSGLARAAGVSQPVISAITKEWRNNFSDPVIPPNSRIGFLKGYLFREGFKSPELYIEIEKNNAPHYAYPDIVCMAVLEYYALESGSSNETALKNYRAFARLGFQEFVYKALQYIPEDKWQHFRDRVSLLRQLGSTPEGHFIDFNEISGMIVDLIVAGLSVNEKTVPDISVGMLWSKYWTQESFDSKYGHRVKCEHIYPDYYPQAKSNPQEVWAYPNGALHEFRHWFRRMYLPTKFPSYILGKAKALKGGSEEAKQIAGMY